MRVVTNKEFIADIALACRIPEDEAKKIFKVILAYWIKEIKSRQYTKIRGFGRFNRYLPRRIHLYGKFVKAKKYIVRFKASRAFKYATVYGEIRQSSHARFLCNKILRLKKANKTKKVIYYKNLLFNYIKDKPLIRAWVEKKGYFDKL